MKVTHVYWMLWFGGIETMLVNIANEQAKLGAGVSVIIINDEVEPTLAEKFCDKVEVHYLGRKAGSGGYGFIWKLNRLLLKLNPDAIHLHDSKIGCFLLPRLSRVASVTLHALPSGTVRRKGMLAKMFPFLNYSSTGNVTLLDAYNKVFAITDAVRVQLKELYGIDSIVVHNGIVTKMFEQRNSSTEVCSPFKIVKVSRYDHEKKGQDLLIRAAAQLPDVEVDLIGHGESEPYLRQLIAELQVGDRVHLLGKKDQEYIRTHLKNYDLFVQASRIEGFGLTVAEAMAANVPTLVSSGQGPAEVTCNDKYGWVFENGSVEDLVKQIKYITLHYSEATDKAGRAHDYVVNALDVSITAKKYLEAYDA